MKKTVNVAFVFDDKFSDLFKVAICSIAENTKSDIAIHIVDCGISDENIKKTNKFIASYDNIVAIQFGKPQRIDVIENLQVEKRFNSSVFYRLSIAKVFPTLDRVIYLDCDVIVDGDIATLWHEDIGNKAFGAVEEDGNFSDEKMIAYKRSRLSLDHNKRYYNSGVLLFDLKNFERARIFERVIEQVKMTTIYLAYPEQDAMNMCVNESEYHTLSPTYNFMPFSVLARQTLKKIKSPLIIHYACFKPWILNKSFIMMLHKFYIRSYSTKILIKFWKYADKVDPNGFSSKNIVPTLKFLYKRLFQPVERMLIRPFGKLLKKSFSKF